MKRLCLTAVFMSCCLICYQQTACTFPQSVSAANTSVSDTKNRTAFHNPACFAYEHKPELTSSFESHYISTSLAVKSLSFAYPTKYFTGGLAFYHYGFSVFHEMNTGIFFARNFSDAFTMGLQFNYHSVYLAQSNKYRGMLYPQMGVHIPLNNRFLIACHIINPFASNIKSENRNITLPSLSSMGIAYSFSEKLTWRFQLDKEIRSAYRLATAFDYQFTKHTRFQLGISHQDYLISAIGFGINIKAFAFDIATETHPILGLNVISQLRYQIFCEKKN